MVSLHLASQPSAHSSACCPLISTLPAWLPGSTFDFCRFRTLEVCQVSSPHPLALLSFLSSLHSFSLLFLLPSTPVLPLPLPPRTESGLFNFTVLHFLQSPGAGILESFLTLTLPLSLWWKPPSVQTVLLVTCCSSHLFGSKGLWIYSKVWSDNEKQN